MATYSSDLLLSILAQGESGVHGFANWGDAFNSNLAFLEDAVTDKSDIAVTTADVTLTDAQQRSLYLNLSGLLTGNRSIILKATQKGFWFVNNATTGAYTITVKPSGGTGVEVTQGSKAIIFSDGSVAVAVAGETSGFIATSDIGVTVQAYDADLTAIAGLTSAANKLPYFTGSAAAAVTDLSSFGRSLIDDADATAAQTTLGLVIGTNVQAYDADLTTWGGKTAPSGTVVGTTDTQTLSGKTITATKETKTAVAASDIDLSAGNFFSKTISGTTTFTVSNVPSTGTAISFILDLTNGGSAAITWWAGVKWALGAAPVLTSSGRDVLGFFTFDGGTIWSGFVIGKDVR